MGSRYENKKEGNGKRRKKGGIGTVLTTLLLIAAIGVFLFSGWKLLGYYLDYKAGSDEYADLNKRFVFMDQGDDDADEPDDAAGDDGQNSSGQSSQNKTDTHTDQNGTTNTDTDQNGTTNTDTDQNGTTKTDTDQNSTVQSVVTGDEQSSTGSDNTLREEAFTEAETELESEIDEEGNIVVTKVRHGKLLKKIEQLENPKTLRKTVAAAEAKETEENGEKRILPMLVNPIDFDSLKEVNEEIIGWIRIGALDISYPVAQASDNDYYLHRTFERQDNFAGCIFLNCDNSKYFTDQNTVVYGHNMKNGSMFGKLKNMKEQKTYDQNPYFWIFTPDYIYQYRIFSCAVVYKQGDPYKTRFTTKDFERFIEDCQSRSEVNNHGLKVTANDRITTLSTCTGDDTTRFIVQGVLTQVYISKKAEQSSSK